MGARQGPFQLSSVVDPSKYVPSASTASLVVAVRVRPLVKSEVVKGNRKDIIKVLDGKVVLVLDPDEQKDFLDAVQNRSKEKRYTFDVAFDTTADNEAVYNGTVADLVGGVLEGINTTIFAYGSTGSGKTYTMVGQASDPGLMVLTLIRLFDISCSLDEEVEVSCSYLEVYNEIIYDLLVKNSGALELREDPDLGVVVAGLKSVSVHTADEILGLLEEGNRRRKTESTDANAQSSRSHAVLEISIKRTPRNQYRAHQLRAKLSLVDLAGSERAAETNNVGQKLRDGANINRSLLALANCINALGKGRVSYVPYRNSKLTRLLKDGLSGNSRTCMIATVSAASDQYHHSINTLKYADRAKEIKTHVVQNVGTVDAHVAQYTQIIDNLQSEVQELRAQLAEQETTPPGMTRMHSSEEDMLRSISHLVMDMNENIEERINLQKALFEIEDGHLVAKHELKQTENFLQSGKGTARENAEAWDRISDVKECLQDIEREKDRCKQDIAANETTRKSIQARIDTIVKSNQNASFLGLLSTFRLQAVRLQELKFHMAVREQVISEQREVIGNLWKIIEKSGLSKDQVLEVARQEGIMMDGLVRRANGQTQLASASLQVQSAGNRAQRPLLAPSPTRLSPNASLGGDRAKIRYNFWSQYAAEAGQLDSSSPTYTTTDADEEQQPQQHSDSASSQKSSPERSSLQPFGGAGQRELLKAGSFHGHVRRVSKAGMRAGGGIASLAPGPVARVFPARRRTSNNVVSGYTLVAPSPPPVAAAVPQGRRAGQPRPHGHYAAASTEKLKQLGTSPYMPPARSLQPIPSSRTSRPSACAAGQADGFNRVVSLAPTLAWADQAVEAALSQPMPIAPQRAPLNERLARIKKTFAVDAIRQGTSTIDGLLETLNGTPPV